MTQRTQLIIKCIFYCAMVLAVTGTWAISHYGSSTFAGWCLVAVTGTSYGVLIAGYGLILGMIMFVFLDLFAALMFSLAASIFGLEDLEEHLRFNLENCAYGCALAISCIVVCAALPPLVGIATSVVAAASAFSILSVGYCHDNQVIRAYLKFRFHKS